MSGARNSQNSQRGTDRHNARLDEAAVRHIRRNRFGLTRRALAQLHRVHWRTIEKVQTFETWRHVR